ncbi:MAG TPA: hypothetical protein VJQ52_08025 [Steroidobacteraceae bacterium]|nr:hypothetical protein [Steroidobacteraceae bacterium]
MHRHVLSLLMFFALFLQGVAAVGGVSMDHGMPQHCAGHDMAQKDCVCCPDGLTTSMSCTAQCSVSQAPVVMIEPVRLVTCSTSSAFVQPAFAGPDYAPLVPPPIA